MRMEARTKSFVKKRNNGIKGGCMSIQKAKAAILVAVLIPTLEAYAVQDCIELARSIVYNDTRSYDEEEQRQITKADFCSEQYRKDSGAKSLQIEASYKVFSGGIAGTEQQIHEEQAKQCEGQFGDFWKRKISSRQARIASSDSLSVINSCLALHRRGLSESATIKSDGSEFVLSLNWNNNTPGSVKVKYIGPTRLSAYRCSVQDESGGLRDVKASKDMSANIPNGGSFSVTCEHKTQEKVTRDGEDFACYPETLITIATEGPNETIRIPKACTPSMPDVRASRIETRLKKAEETNKSLSDQLAKLKTERSVDSVFTKGEIARLDSAINAATKKGVSSIYYHYAGGIPAGRAEGECVSIREGNGLYPQWNDNFLCINR